MVNSERSNEKCFAKLLSLPQSSIKRIRLNISSCPQIWAQKWIKIISMTWTYYFKITPTVRVATTEERSKPNMHRAVRTRTEVDLLTELVLPSYLKTLTRHPPPTVRDWTVSPTNSYIESLSPHMTVFGVRAIKEVMKVQWGHKGGTLIQ